MSRFDLRDLFRARTPQERIGALHLRPDLARAAVVLVADQRVEVELTEVESLLLAEESVLMLVEGRHARRLGLLVLTTRRVLFRAHGDGSPVVPAYQLADLSTSESSTGSFTGRVVLRFADAVLEVDRVLGTLADQFAVAVQAQREAADRRIPGTGSTPRDPLQELGELRSRRAAGHISQADYESAKARLVEEL